MSRANSLDTEDGSYHAKEMDEESDRIANIYVCLFISSNLFVNIFKHFYNSTNNYFLGFY